MWMRYFPAVKKIKELITTGALGTKNISLLSSFDSRIFTL
jgi:predicted dehydrogenase